MYIKTRSRKIFVLSNSKLQGVPPASSFTGKDNEYFDCEDGFDRVKPKGVSKMGYLMKKQNNSYASRHFSGKKQGKFQQRMYDFYKIAI